MNRVERDKQAITLVSDRVYTFREAQEILRVSTPTLKKIIRGNILQARKIGGKWFITGRAILNALDAPAENCFDTTATK